MTMRQMIRTTTEAGTLTVLTHRGFAELVHDVGDYDKAMRWLVKQATRAGVPIAVNFPTTPDPNGPSTTVMISPTGWTQERLNGWLAGRHEELAQTFGDIESVRTPGSAA